MAVEVQLVRRVWYSCFSIGFFAFLATGCSDSGVISSDLDVNSGDGHYVVTELLDIGRASQIKNAEISIYGYLREGATVGGQPTGDYWLVPYFEMLAAPISTEVLTRVGIQIVIEPTDNRDFRPCLSQFVRVSGVLRVSENAHVWLDVSGYDPIIYYIDDSWDYCGGEGI